MSDLYITCPRCRGHRFVSVIIRAGDGWRPTLSEYVSCPLCHATGVADAERANEWNAEQLEDA